MREHWLQWIRANLLGLVVFVTGLILTGFGLWQALKSSVLPPEVVIEPPQESTAPILVDIAGAVRKPGVYRLSQGERLVDLLGQAEGFLDTADEVWVTKRLNQAEVLKDGQKIYIPFINEQTGEVAGVQSGTDQATGADGLAAVNVNTASQSELESLWGVGEARARDIMANRPYGALDELVSKAKLPQSVLDKNQNIISLY